MASAKTTEKLFRDLREATAKKREAAAKKLRAIDPLRARELLLTALDEATKPAARKVIVRCLHHVADIAVARMIATSASFTLQPENLPADVLRILYEDLGRELSSLDVKEARTRLETLGILALANAEEIPPLREQQFEEGEATREALVTLLLRVIEDERLLPMRADVAAIVRRLDTRRGNEALLARWQAEPIGANAVDAYAAWVRLGCPKDPTNHDDRVVQIHESLIEHLMQGAPRSVTMRDLDDLFASNAEHIPAALVAKMLVALGKSDRNKDLGRMKVAVARRLVDQTRGAAALIALLEDGRYEACHASVAEALVASGVHGARAVLTRSERIPREVLSVALGKIPPTEAYDFVAARLEEDPSWYGTITNAEGALRDPRWVDWIAKMDPLTEQGRAILVEIARDTHNDSRARAITVLSVAARRATDRIDKRYALHALGQTGHPNATTALVEALDDPAIGDAVPLVCTALGECGDTRAIRVLEKRLKGPHQGFVQNAIDAIKSRVTQIHEDVLLAACQDEDPVIADLARQAREGDMDAAIVLEDALRDRGRL